MLAGPSFSLAGGHDEAVEEKTGLAIKIRKNVCKTSSPSPSFSFLARSNLLEGFGKLTHSTPRLLALNEAKKLN